MKTCNVSCDAVVEGAQILIEFTDGTMKLYPWHPYSRSDGPKRLLWLRPDQIEQEIGRRNTVYRAGRPGSSYHPPSSIAGAAFWR